MTSELICTAGFNERNLSGRRRSLSFIIPALRSPHHALRLRRLRRLVSPFLFNQIPTAMISPVASCAVSLLRSIPLRSTASLQQNAVDTTGSAQNVDQGDLKIDFKASEKDSIFWSLYPRLSEQSVDQFSGAAVQLLLHYAYLQHGGRLDANDQQQPGE